MAQTPKTFAEYTADGSTSQFSVAFPYQNRDEVFVTVDGVNVAFSFSTSQTVLLSTAPPQGAVVRVQRSTAAFNALHEFALNAPFLPEYVDANNEQFLYVLQETNDGLRDVQRDFKKSHQELRSSVDESLADIRLDFTTTQDALRDKLNQKLADIQASTGEASMYAKQAAVSAQASASFTQAAQRAAEASGDVRFFNTYAEAVAAMLNDGQVVEVLADETRNNRSTRYRLESGVLVYKQRGPLVADQPGIFHGSTFTEDPLWPEDSNGLLIGPVITIGDGVTVNIPDGTVVTISDGTEIKTNV